MSETITLTINGRSVTVIQETTILNAANRNWSKP